MDNFATVTDIHAGTLVAINLDAVALVVPPRRPQGVARIRFAGAHPDLSICSEDYGDFIEKLESDSRTLAKLKMCPPGRTAGPITVLVVVERIMLVTLSDGEGELLFIGTKGCRVKERELIEALGIGS